MNNANGHKDGNVMYEKGTLKYCLKFGAHCFQGTD